jgi:hypothetical protein
MAKPYVVSADIQLLLARWAEKAGFVMPTGAFMFELREEFRAFMKDIFPEFEFVPEAELVEGMNVLVAESGLMPVCLERVYLHGALHLDISRLVRHNGNDCGFGHRPHTPPLFQQFKKLKGLGLKEVVLVDDVVFSGVHVERVIRCLSRLDIRVPLVCAGVGIAEGVKRIGESKCEVRCVRAYDEVIDEVCERDFYPGVPLSGRLLVGGQNFGVPYVLPLGKPGEWASIPSEWQKRFSEFCVSRAVRLFEEVEARSERMVSCAQLGRMVATLPRDETRFVDALMAL